MKTLICNATLINEGETFRGSLRMEDGYISEISRNEEPPSYGATVIDAQGALVIPGVIDEHVHMREPGMTHKGNMESETRAAAAGGVTSVLDMPNVAPPTTTMERLEERLNIARKKCYVNYGFFLGASNDNLKEIRKVDTSVIPGVKVFMGSSTGNMLVDKEEALYELFRQCPTLLMTHCEDTSRINHQMETYKALHGDDPDVCFHPLIRDAEACMQSTKKALQMAKETGARLHVAHLTTADELQLFTPNDNQITAEACVAHLLYSDADYKRLGSRIKCNPAIKTLADRDALRKGLNDGHIRCIATDHAPHLLGEKEGGCCKAMSGMPMVQFSLPSMLELTDEGVLSLERMVQLMCHNPAQLFGIEKRGFLREGYHADIVVVRKSAPWKVTKECIESLCGWSPREGDELHWSVEKTWVNGELVWNGKEVNTSIFGKQLTFGCKNC